MVKGKVDGAVLPETRLSTSRVADAFTQAVLHRIKKEIEEACMAGPIELARAYVVLKESLETIEESIKPFKELVLRVKEVELPNAFDVAGVPTVNLEEGFRVTVSYNVRASIRSGRKEDAINYLTEKGYGDIVTTTVNASTLSSLAKDMASENEELDDSLFNVAIMPTTSVTKTSK